MEREDLIIGPSNGWMYAISIYEIEEQISFLRLAGASALEVCFARWGTDGNRKRMESVQPGLFCNKFRFLSFHLPDFSRWSYPRVQIEKISELVAINMPNAALIHPLKGDDDLYPEDYYRDLRSAGVPLAIENMDRDKGSGFLIREILGLVESFGLGFVLDVQHAFEHDSSMKYARELFDALQEAIVHFHVSGETEINNHSLVCQARNQKAILDFLGWAFSQKPAPLILEGKYRDPDGLKEEIDFLKRELTSG